MSRLQRFREQLKQLNLDGMIITNLQNRRYLSGFTGSSGVLLISESKAVIVTDFRYWQQVSEEVKDFDLHRQGPNLWQSVFQFIKGLSWKQVGFEAAGINYYEYQQWKEIAPQLELVPTNDLVEQLRWIKDEAEISKLAEAARITDYAWENTIKIMKPGVKEMDLALEFDYQLRLNGAEGSAFTTIVASGARSALPHGTATAKEILPGDLVVIDGGALYQGYHADMTRTVVLGNATSEQFKIYDIVLSAQMEALANLKAGLTGKTVDGVAREIIVRHGHEEHFGHGLGHSVGLDIHERPRLSQTEIAQVPAGAAVTVEPGIYIPGWGGIRIEDLVIVEKDGYRNLTGSPKNQLIEI
jgi:Xaa-Pro aminopeptidase/Xaa-Pro dipeptidase